MVSVRLLPHLQASPNSIQWGGWWYELGGTRSPAEGIVGGWDYSTPISFQLQPSIDEGAFLSSTKLDDLAHCDFVAVVECPPTGLRATAKMSLAQLFDDSEKTLVINPSPSTLADWVTLSAHVVLNRNLPVGRARSASKLGSRLASSSRTRLILEGEGGRFPTEAVSFKELGYPPAPWLIRGDLSDPHEMFNTAVRLFINTDHSIHEAILNPSDESSKLPWSALRTDIVRQLVSLAANDLDSYVDAEFEEGTVGHALDSLCDLYFGRSFVECVKIRKMDPFHWQMELMAQTEMFEV